MGKGMTNALAALCRENYRLAVVSLRPSLTEALLKHLPGRDVSVCWLDEGNRNIISDSIIAELEKIEAPDIE